jgi:hypothetical protein
MRDFALEVCFSKWEFAAKYHMTASDIESMTIGELLDMAPGSNLSALEQQWLGGKLEWIPSKRTSSGRLN